jgi:hypothetical protein
LRAAPLHLGTAGARHLLHSASFREVTGRAGQSSNYSPSFNCRLPQALVPCWVAKVGVPPTSPGWCG